MGVRKPIGPCFLHGTPLQVSRLDRLARASKDQEEELAGRSRDQEIPRKNQREQRQQQPTYYRRTTAPVVQNLALVPSSSVFPLAFLYFFIPNHIYHFCYSHAFVCLFPILYYALWRFAWHLPAQEGIGSTHADIWRTLQRRAELATALSHLLKDMVFF